MPHNPNPAELIINDDGSVFHLHLRPEEVADTVFLVGDPSRVDAVASRFDRVELRRSSREFVTATGFVGAKRITVLSTGIGCDNIDIAVTELDALVNVDFATREVKKEHRSLTLVRLGTSGAIDPNIELGTMVVSDRSVGIDGLAYFYGGSERVRDLAFEEEWIQSTSWDERLARPYVVRGDAQLIEAFGSAVVRGVTVSASGFYGPQGRVVRLPLERADYIARLEAAGVTNFEMEGAAIGLLGALLGHRTLTLCAIIAQRTEGKAKADYRQFVDKMIDLAVGILVR